MRRCFSFTAGQLTKCKSRPLEIGLRGMVYRAAADACPQCKCDTALLSLGTDVTKRGGSISRLANLCGKVEYGYGEKAERPVTLSSSRRYVDPCCSEASPSQSVGRGSDPTIPPSPMAHQGVDHLLRLTSRRRKSAPPAKRGPVRRSYCAPIRSCAPIRCQTTGKARLVLDSTDVGWRETPRRCGLAC